MRSLSWIGQGIRYALRQVRGSAGFSALAVLSLTLGIGGTIAIFSVMYALTLKPLPVFEPDRLIQISRSDQVNLHSYKEWKQLQKLQQDTQRPLSGVLAYYPWDNQLVLRDGTTDQALPGLYVSGSYFPTLGVQALLGRTLTPADDSAGAPPVCVISYGLWQRQFGKSRAAVGRAIDLNGHSFQVVGVGPPSFFGLEVGKNYDLFLPLEMQSAFQDYQRFSNGNAKPKLNAGNALVMMGRLGEGVRMGQSDAWLRVAGKEIFQTLNPGADTHNTLIARPMPNGISRNYFGDVVLLMVVMAGVALLIVCANLGNLLLVRGMRRQGDLAVRLALGATRGRLLAQLLLENALLSIVGTAGGLLFAHWARQALLPVVSFSGLAPTVLDLSWDHNLVLFTLGITLACSLLFGLAPAMQATRLSPNAAIQKSATTLTARSRLANGILIAAQVALSISLFACAGLLVRTEHALLAKDPGYEAKGILVEQVKLSGVAGSSERPGFEGEELLEKFRAAPGVVSASWTANPLTSIPPSISVAQPGGTSRQVRGYRLFVSPDYFKTRRTPMLTGREFDGRDISSSIAVAVLSEQAAKAWFPGSNPAGQTFFEEDAGAPGERQPVKVIGVARNIDFQAPQYGPLPMFFRPASQCPACAPMGRYELRFAGPMAGLPERLRKVADSLDPMLAMQSHLLTDELREVTQQNRVAAGMGTLAGLFAGLLAMIGVYGVTAYAVSQRTREIGIRMTLGAQRSHTFRMVLGDTAVMVSGGVGLGIPAGLAGARIIRGLLWGVAPDDLRSLGYAVAFILVVAFAAAFLPARRATRTNPMVCLRYE